MKSPDHRAALAALIEGNRRFAEGTAEHPRQDARRREEVLEKGQYPFAAIVGCADSRVSPEIVFDQGLGDLFVIRVAGNLVDDFGLASLEYVVSHLGTPLIAVMGHTRCGAVTAAMAAEDVPGRLSAIITALGPSIEKARGASGDLVETAARESVKSTVAALKASGPVLRPLVERGTLRIVGMFYDIERGTVEVIS
jgi:carbonic anhydrase